MGAFKYRRNYNTFLTRRIGGIWVNIIEKVPDTMKNYPLVFIQIKYGELYKNAGWDIVLLSINGNLENK